jgi:hypothetical protein
MKRSRDDVLFAACLALWVAIIMATWPQALSFADEVGYVGRAKLLLEGHLRDVPGSPGGVVGAYSLLQSLLLVPLAALWPKAMFALAVGEAVLLAIVARAILRSWGKSPLWAGLVLAHPTIAILARTATADVGLAAAALAGWWALRRGRRAATVAWLAILAALEPAGAVLALGLVGGEALSRLDALREGDPTARRRLVWGLAGVVAGLLIAFGLNVLGSGRVWPAPTRELFEPGHTHLATLLLSRVAAVVSVPPLLVTGALPYWRRRELGPLVACAALFATMGLTSFVDVGANSVETLLLAPRHLLPLVAFLLVGYAELLDDLAGRLGATQRSIDGTPPAPHPLLAWVLCVLPLVVVAGVSRAHSRHQRDMSFVRDVASEVADAHGERTLGITANATKAGLMHEGPTTLYEPAVSRPAAVFCSELPSSHWLAAHLASAPRESCALPGYHAVSSRAGFFALARDDAGGDAL